MQARGGKMFDRRTLFSAIAIISLLATGDIALAKNEHHHNGKALLGEKIKQNGKHHVGKAGTADVIAEVNNGKVVNMSAGNLPVRKVKSRKKMADRDGVKIQVAANGRIQLAQAQYISYGYCFDSGADEYCYWYSADDVLVSETWVEY
jgi:hypothetical protein